MVVVRYEGSIASSITRRCRLSRHRHRPAGGYQQEGKLAKSGRGGECRLINPPAAIAADPNIPGESVAKSFSVRCLAGGSHRDLRVGLSVGTYFLTLRMRPRSVRILLVSVASRRGRLLLVASLLSLRRFCKHRPCQDREGRNRAEENRNYPHAGYLPIDGRPTSARDCGRFLLKNFQIRSRGTGGSECDRPHILDRSAAVASVVLGHPTP